MTTHFSSHLRRPIALLTGLSLVVGLFVITPATTSAQSTDPAPDYLASFDACPEDAIGDADFADVPGRHENASDINCIAYYGITKGTSPTTYSPDRPVIREHMALFLIRLANLVDIYVPPAGDTPFTDIADLSQESQDTISQIYQLGITIGTSATTYTPSRNVSRGEMALFLQRLMDQMDVVADGRDLYGYIPDDVDDNDLDADIEAPWRDIDDVPFAVNEAVTELYELGVASGFGGSVRLYAPDRDMSRADMAAFMAAILDHSNLRPKGANIQVSPTVGADDYDITVMISARSDTFAPQEDQAVDWFYTDDADGGLERNGECDISTILGDGDCQWDDDDEETDRDGNFFEEVRATAGETMTFYAWIGRRNGDDFDEDSVDHSKAVARSNKGPSSLLVTHDVPANAWQMGGEGGAWIVDMDRRSSVEFTIQLQDETGAILEREGVVIDIEVDSREILVDADNVDDYKPDPDYSPLRREPRDTSTVVTDRRGEATFELDGPSRNERLDEVTFETDCCTQTVEIAWSEADPVLVSAKPSFDFYQERNSDGEVRFTVEYNLYDQYGNALRSHTTRNTGRQGDVREDMKYVLYTVDCTTTANECDPGAGGGDQDVTAQWSRGRLRSTLEVTAAETAGPHFILVKPQLCSTSATSSHCADSDTARIEYAEEQVVWVVKGARGDEDFDPLEDDSFASSFDDAILREVDIYPADNKFRTFFTLWDYDSGDRFQAGGEDISLQEFEERWKNAVTDVEDINILLYSTGLSFFLIK